ncbi:cell wall-binding repeat-containing protein [Herbiconiux sp. VKM Ac-2851]|uniref:cell wall-binding repeat-containing protein n=1 Tax=Herbiconiux sp. VKM Ac-2851 TaxID=2739025 RepID=UPI00156337E8|nr:cell wall-binding repeat-containing protein [Herbiconiux sp. VKM Ac-2851]NQX33616.1 cell wall-binding repeat-containing protein [Herbiconiux sp. VKM Ac-2851]
MTLKSHPRRTASLLASTVGLAILTAGVVAGPAAAGTSIFCIPDGAQAGVAFYNQSAYDADVGSPKITLVGGALPDGVSLFDGGWYTDYVGAPKTPGAYDYVLQGQEKNGGAPFTEACHVTIVADLQIVPGITVSRVQGPDRFAGSVAASRAMVPGTAPLVYLASGENFADALSAGSPAAERQAPLLLATKAGIPSVVLDELKRLQPANIVLMGGEAALGASVEAQLAGLPSPPAVTRIGGADRFEVSRNLLTNTSFGPTDPTKILLATGRNFPDALSASPAFAQDRIKGGVLLVDGAQASLSAGETAVLSAIKPTFVGIMGGPAAVSEGIEQSVTALTPVPQTHRLNGSDRYFVSSRVAEEYFTHPGFPESNPDTVYLATGANYPDALSGVPLAKVTNSPVLLSRQDCIPADAAFRINRMNIKKVVLLGGDDVLSPDVAALTVCRP